MNIQRIAIVGLALSLGACTLQNNRRGAEVPTDVGTIVLEADTSSLETLEEFVFFDFDSATLSEASRSELDQMVAWLKANPEHVTAIYGQTDELGTATYNYKLGLLRAEAVRDYLRAKGVKSSRIKVESQGEVGPKRGLDSLKRRAFVVARKKKS